MFMGKGMAYAQGDLVTIRAFHTALGAYYAAKGQWTGPDARNAEFQLSHMREVTQRLANDGKRVSDPPELLAKLANHYQQKGDTVRAAAVAKDVRTYYAVRRRPDKADVLLMRVQQPRVVRPQEMMEQQPQKSDSTQRVSPAASQMVVPNAATRAATKAATSAATKDTAKAAVRTRPPRT
jgi:deoxyribodipyrimidine photolyase